MIVNLYTVTNGEVSGTPEKTTRTDENGYYLFTDLEDGSYVVEFDIRGVKPTMGGGHAERFYFTKMVEQQIVQLILIQLLLMKIRIL